MTKIINKIIKKLKRIEEKKLLTNPRLEIPLQSYYGSRKRDFIYE
jgi:hypothetical protein